MLMDDTFKHILPKIGLGTYNMTSKEAEVMTYESIKHGYRHIDTAAVYKNEDGVAKALQRIFAETNIERKDVYITTKLWPGGLIKLDRVRNYKDTLKSFEKSLMRLNLEYVDLYLIHSPHAKTKRIDQWKSLIELKESGKVKFIGVSNWGANHINELKENNLPLPDANQIEIHPWSQKPDLVNYLKENKINIIAYSSLVPLSTWRHKDGENSKKTTEMYEIGSSANSPFKLLANKYNCSEPQFLLQWAIQQNFAVLPKTIDLLRMRENFDFNFFIEEDDMHYISTLDMGDSVTWEYGDPLKVT